MKILNHCANKSAHIDNNDHWFIPDDYRKAIASNKELAEFYFYQSEERLKVEMRVAEKTKNRNYTLLGVLITLITLVVTIATKTDNRIISNFSIIFFCIYLFLLIIIIYIIRPTTGKGNGIPPKKFLTDDMFNYLKNEEGGINYINTLVYYTEISSKDIETQANINAHDAKIFNWILFILGIILSISSIMYLILFLC